MKITADESTAEDLTEVPVPAPSDEKTELGNEIEAEETLVEPLPLPPEETLVEVEEEIKPEVSKPEVKVQRPRVPKKVTKKVPRNTPKFSRILR